MQLGFGSGLAAQSAVSWTSLTPALATGDASGKVTARAPGQARVQATVNGISASLFFSVTAPARAPEIDLNPTGLNMTAPNSLYEIPVVIFRYLPTTDGTTLDVGWAPDYWSLNPLPISQVKSTVETFDRRVKFMLEEGSRFRGYGNGEVRVLGIKYWPRSPSMNRDLLETSLPMAGTIGSTGSRFLCGFRAMSISIPS